MDESIIATPNTVPVDIDLASPIVRRQLFRAALRRNLSPFIQKAFQTIVPGEEYVHNWHIDAIAYALECCAEHKIRRLIISVPPRLLKSIAAAVAFPAYLLGLRPESRIIVASYAQELADKHARDCRAVMASPWYREIFPRTRLERDAMSDFMTTRRGFRLATSVGGQLTGRGGEFLIIDDPQKPQDVHSKERREGAHEWMSSTLRSRLDDQSKGVIIVVQQRLHEDDLSGRLLSQGGWHHLNLPAIADKREVIRLSEERRHTRHPGELLDPVRLPQRALDELKSDLGSVAFSAQYLQSPTPVTGNLIKWEWFQFYDAVPEPERDDRIVQSWDTASKADELNNWSVCTTALLRGTSAYILDVYRARIEFPVLCRRALVLAEKFGCGTAVIEEKGSGIQLIQMLKSESKLHVVPVTPKYDKITRMSVQTPLIERGAVYLPRQASWLEAFKAELLAFPGGRHDDQVDSFSQALEWIDAELRRPKWYFC